MKRISALDNLPVLDASGKRLGRLHELHAVKGQVTELVYGSAGLLERLTGRSKPVRKSWPDVAEVSATAIKLKVGK